MHYNVLCVCILQKVSKRKAYKRLLEKAGEKGLLERYGEWQQNIKKLLYEAGLLVWTSCFQFKVGTNICHF